MLNISNNRVTKYVSREKYDTLKNVEDKVSSKVLRRLLYCIFGLGLIILFLPWTQNIRTDGSVVTIHPNQRPQSLNATIDGRIEEWYVKEGDFVQKGDTVLRISEIKAEYFDPKLLERTADQIDVKKQSVDAYSGKVSANENIAQLLTDQYNLKRSQLSLKLKQVLLKVESDSIAYQASIINERTARAQMNRADSLYKIGLKSLTDLEKRIVKHQDAQNKLVEKQNKWFSTQNDRISTEIEFSNIEAKYLSDLNKVTSDKLSAVSGQMNAEAEVTKLENSYSNYEFRNGLYYIIAPQNGFITKIMKGSIGENVKVGDAILSLMPKSYDLAVEIFVKPIDLPLVKLNEKVRLQFDGWPAIVFAGWPNVSHGTYGGEIYAIDQFISQNGKYRVLVQPDKDDYPWPEALRFGGGANAMILLNDVPIWYELWRNINGFPPDFYEGKDQTDKSKMKKDADGGKKK